jgi:hypothetical protein
VATARDLVEAHTFSRRRLVTAFVSGAPGGREVEPVRPGRTIVGGVVLALLLIAGAALSGVVAGVSEVDRSGRGDTHPVSEPAVRVTAHASSGRRLRARDQDWRRIGDSNP